METTQSTLWKALMQFAHPKQEECSFFHAINWNWMGRHYDHYAPQCGPTWLKCCLPPTPIFQVDFGTNALFPRLNKLWLHLPQRTLPNNRHGSATWQTTVSFRLIMHSSAMHWMISHYTTWPICAATNHSHHHCPYTHNKYVCGSSHPTQCQYTTTMDRHRQLV